MTTAGADQATARRLYAFQNRALALLNSLENGFYLSGGTAAGRGYLNHRLSDDLDFCVNDDPRFALWAEQSLVRLQQEPAWDCHVLAQEERYFALLLTLAGMHLKVQFLNDGPVHAGKIIQHPALGRLDSAENILAAAVSALAAREEPKDLADIWGLCTRLNLSLRAVLNVPESKAAGLFPPDVARILCSATQTDWQVIRWLQAPPPEAYLAQLRQLGEGLLRPRSGKTAPLSSVAGPGAPAANPPPARSGSTGGLAATAAAPNVPAQPPANAAPPGASNGLRRTGMLNLAASLKAGAAPPPMQPSEPMLPPLPPVNPAPPAGGTGPLRQTGRLTDMMQRMAAAAATESQMRNLPSEQEQPAPPASPPPPLAPVAPTPPPTSGSGLPGTGPLRSTLMGSIGRATAELRNRARRRVSYYIPIRAAADGRMLGHLADISENGLRMDCKNPLLPGAVMQLRLDLPPELSRKPFLNFTAECRWCRQDELEPALFNAGFQVVHISAEEQQIYRHLMEIYSSRPTDQW
jgi:hypothetical protein